MIWGNLLEINGKGGENRKTGIFLGQSTKECWIRSNLTFDLILQESYTYKDPITEFVECLYVNFDFDGAQKKLRECESVSMNFYL